MGFDTSYHPVDITTIQSRVIPYIMGRGDIDDLTARAVHLAKVRFRANAWGLSALEAMRDDARFDSQLHVWGRPFFVTSLDAAGVTAAIDRYLAAQTLDDVDAIASEMLARFGLADSLAPSEKSGTLPDDEGLARNATQNLDLLRKCWASLDGSGTVELDGELEDARAILARETPYVVLEFAANLCPGWMDRGPVWPTASFDAQAVTMLFEPPREILGALTERTDIEWFLEPTITENYMVGGYVKAARVPALRDTLQLLANNVDPKSATSVRKLIEAVSDAATRGMAFAEATEIYSGFSGVMN